MEGKEKVRTIEVKAIHGDYQEVVINGNYHEFNIYFSPETVINELSKYYDFSEMDKKDLEVMW